MCITRLAVRRGSSRDVDRRRLISDHPLSTEAMNDKNRPLEYEVCSDCFSACPHDPALRYILPHKCRSPGLHRRSVTVLVTCHEGVLVRVPPSDKVMAGLRGQFVMCQAGLTCKRSRCSYPHTEEERDFWNSALEGFKVRQRARPVNPVQPVPLHPHQRLPPLSPPSIPPVRHSIKPQSQQKIVQQSKKSRPQVGIQVKKPTPKKQPPPHVYSVQFQRDDFPTVQESARLPRKVHSSGKSSGHTHAPKGRTVVEMPRPPSQSLRNKSDSLHCFEHDHQLRDQKLLSAILTVDNYKEKFHQLLCREEDEHEKILRDKCDGVYELTIYQHNEESPSILRGNDYGDHKVEHDVRYGHISASHLDGDKVAYAEQACEMEGNLVICHAGKEYSASMVAPDEKKRLNRLVKMKQNSLDIIYIRMKKADALKLKNVKCQFEIAEVEVMFELKYSYFDRLHKALDHLSHSTIQRLIPSNRSCFSTPREYPSLPLSHKYKQFLTLDYGQRKALETIVYAEPRKAPVIVVGSFGTGKTQMLARAAFEIFTAKYEERPRVLVCAHHQKSANSFLNNYFGPMKEQGWKVNVVRMIPFNRMKDIEECYQKYCMTGTKVAQNLHSFQLVVTTFGNCLSLLSTVRSRHWFTHILIDEGAQTREPETIMPLILCRPETVITIAGDHKQVGPPTLVLGDDPLKNGLEQSLLERLHTFYTDQIGADAESHCATLLNNYRCHRSLLALPSYLFYHSALLANRAAVTQALLHPDTTYSLHFICSSLDDEVVEVKDSTNRDEAMLLLNAAANYIKHWPNEEWGEKDLKTVCVMATTGNQQNLISVELKRNHQLRKDLSGNGSIQIRKAFDMQGLEYQCVFLSTAEPTTAEGASKNPTKTPCSQYVFNTALTRAKSLVVCAGNPFLLMKIEKMTKNRDKRPFWAEYIRRCMENETFVIPPNLLSDDTKRQDQIKLLRELVFTSSRKLFNSSDITVDSITKAYKTAFENRPSLQKCQLQLKYALGGMHWDIHNNPSSTPKPKLEYPSRGRIACYLEILDHRRALGHPLDISKQIVTLNGLKHWKGALDGDLVMVELYATEDDDDKSYGKVVEVVQKCHQEKYICRVDRYSTIHFNPIDRNAPRFVNLPKISRDLMRLRKRDIDDGLTSQHDWVVIFEEDSLPQKDGDDLPRIKEIISAESARRLLFVVREMGWERDHRLPLGAVVECLPLGTNSFYAERILRAAYNIQLDDEEEEEEEEIGGQLPEGLIQQAFTIDPSNAVNLDDALSLVHERDGTYIMSVLITNVGGQMEKGGEDDQRAQARGNSVYGIYHSMLSAKVCQKLSLTPKKVRNVLIVSTKVTVTKDGTVIVEDTEPVIREGMMQSQVKLDYAEAQCLLNNDPSKFSASLTDKITEYFFQPNLPKSLDLLYKIAMWFRVERLGRLSAQAYRFSEEDVESSWQAHLLVEELMIWANSTVARYVCNKLPGFAILRRQPGPNEEKADEFLKMFSGVIDHSVALRKELAGRSAIKNENKSTEPLLIPSSTLVQLQNAVTERDTSSLQRLLTSDYLYPQLASAAAHLIVINQKAEYVCSSRASQLVSAGNSPFHHHSLCLDYYTHFTSPIRRFCDVVAQRLLLAILNRRETSYTVEQLEKLCWHLNVRSREAGIFEKKVKQLEFAQHFGESCEVTRASVHKNQNRLEIEFSELKYRSCVKRENASFYVSALACKEKKGFLNWKVFMYSFQGNDFILHNPQLCFSNDEYKNAVITMTVFYKPESERSSAPEASDSHLHEISSSDLESKDTLHALKLSSTLTQDLITVDAAKWQNIIGKVDNLSEDTIQQLSDMLPKPQPEVKTCYPHSATTVDQFSASPVLKYEIKRKLDSNSIVPVWLGQTLLKEPILSPCIQLMEVAPGLHICLEHNKHPAECFSDPHFGQASKATYSSLDTYVSLWEKVFLAEVAEDSVKQDGEKSVTILKDVPLQWPKLTIPKTSTDLYYIPEGPVTLTIPPEKRDFLHFGTHIRVGDLVCVRYDVKEEQCRAVYHFVVAEAYVDNKSSDHDEEEDEDEEKFPLVVKMKHIGKNSCHVSPKMAAVLRKHKPTCEMQVINLQVSHNRVYKVLVSLRNHDMVHARTDGRELLVPLVARGDIEKVNKLKNPLRAKALNVLKTDPMAHTLWSDNSELNKVQKEAITLALTNCFQLIQGPPGTGKSETGAHIAYIFAQLLEDHQCVVYCAPSNKAVDVVHDKLIQANEKLGSKGGTELKLLRLYGKVHEKNEFHGPYTSQGYLPPAEGEGRCEQRFRRHALHHIIRKDVSKLTKMEERFEEMHNAGLVPTPKMLVRYRTLIRDMEKKVIGKHYDVILATCNECAGYRLSNLRKTGRVAQVIVDECGMAYEPETIVAVSLSNHVVLIGDHKQLQPVIKLSAARENGLSTSLFQRYAENFKDKFPLITLKVQYRMHPKICKFPSEFFYDDMLEPSPSVMKRPKVTALRNFWPAGPFCPIVFCDVVGKERYTSALPEGQKGSGADSHSKGNLEEAEKAVEIARFLKKRLPGVEIAILTPYKTQTLQISAVIKTNEHHQIKVRTINDSQGDEYDYVILTTVRSQPLSEIRNPDLVQPDRKWLHENLGFVTDPHQVNVAITRAKQGLIIVGNRTLLEYDNDTWKPLVQFYKENKCVIHGSKFPHS